MQHEVESVILLRISNVEQQLKLLQEQLKSYVPMRENELQLQSIQGTVSRIEHDVIDVKLRVESQEKETREHEEEQRESQAALQIKVLWGVVSLVIVSGATIFTGYILHFFH
ncbi:MAG TPA: hypothetical protein VL485_13615 [Ktedonobacteraceae bacterium]|jgi:hypothetical protein|nr:hypothetical protein [Ktedonobacteraceae bacterium]